MDLLYVIIIDKKDDLRKWHLATPEIQKCSNDRMRSFCLTCNTFLFFKETYMKGDDGIPSWYDEHWICTLESSPRAIQKLFAHLAFTARNMTLLIISDWDTPTRRNLIIVCSEEFPPAIDPRDDADGFISWVSHIGYAPLRYLVGGFEKGCRWNIKHTVFKPSIYNEKVKK